MAIIGFITPVMYLFNIAESDVETITSIIMAGASLIAFILTEGYVDANRFNFIEIEEDLPDDALE